MIFNMKWVRVRQGVYNLKYYGPKKLLPKIGDILTIEGESGKYKTVDLAFMTSYKLNRLNNYASAEFSVNV